MAWGTIKDEGAIMDGLVGSQDWKWQISQGYAMLEFVYVYIM